MNIFNKKIMWTIFQPFYSEHSNSKQELRCIVSRYSHSRVYSWKLSQSHIANSRHKHNQYTQQYEKHEQIVIGLVLTFHLTMDDEALCYNYITPHLDYRINTESITSLRNNINCPSYKLTSFGTFRLICRKDSGNICYLKRSEHGIYRI